MKSIKLVACFLLLYSSIRAEFILQPEIKNGFDQSSIGESGGLYILGVDEKIFTRYIQTNWKSIIENIDILQPETSNNKPQIGPNLNWLSILNATCEELSPSEYLDYLDKLLVLFHTTRQKIKKS
jgi:hypothetical protein